MTSFFKGLALFVALCCLVWVAVLWHWQNTQRDMSVSDVVVYLAALPLTLFALVLLGGWAWRGASAKADASATAKVAGAAPSTAAATPSKDDAARHATWQLLGAHGNTTLGATADEWLAAAEAQQPMPALDGELRDDAGLPVMTARVPGVDLAALDETLAPLLKTLQPQHPQLELSEPFLRVLALLREPLAAAVADLAPWAPTLGVERPKVNNARAAAATDAPPLADARIGVLVAWPVGLNALETAVAPPWLTEQLHQAGAGLVAPQRWAVLPPAAAQPEAASTGVAGPRLWLQADAWFEAQRREERQDPLLLMAAHSDMDDGALAHLQAHGGVFSAGTPKGTIPGEAAVALLLAPAAWPADPDAEVPKPHLHRAAVAQRDKRIDAPGRVSHELVEQLVTQATAAAQLAPTELGAVLNDANQHTPRSAELFGVMLAQLPKLDATEDMRMTGQLCGHIGACGTLMAAAMAAQQAGKLGQPCLALSLGDAQWRAALVARPAAPPSGAATAAAPPKASSGPGA
jgi:hypothetical protein